MSLILITELQDSPCCPLSAKNSKDNLISLGGLPSALLKSEVFKKSNVFVLSVVLLPKLISVSCAV